MGDDGLERRQRAVLELLPPAVRQAALDRDIAGLKVALAALPPDAVSVVVGQLRDVGILAGGEERSAEKALLDDFAPLVADIVSVARGDEKRRALVEQVLAGLAEVGWQLRYPVTMLWGGERDAEVLTRDLEDEGLTLVATLPFPDHCRYGEKDVAAILRTLTTSGELPRVRSIRIQHRHHEHEGDAHRAEIAGADLIESGAAAAFVRVDLKRLDGTRISRERKAGNRRRRFHSRH